MNHLKIVPSLNSKRRFQPPVNLHTKAQLRGMTDRTQDLEIELSGHKTFKVAELVYAFHLNRSRRYVRACLFSISLCLADKM
jgi:hypothetical protein